MDQGPEEEKEDRYGSLEALNTCHKNSQGCPGTRECPCGYPDGTSDIVWLLSVA